MDRQRHAIHQRVRHADGHDREGSQREAIARNHLDQIGVVEQPMLFQLALDVGQGELSAVDGNVQLGEDPRQAADVVFMSVGQQDCADLAPVFSQVTDIGNNNVDTQQLFFRKHQTGIDDNNVILPTEDHAVHTELAEAPQRYHLQLIVICHSTFNLSIASRTPGRSTELILTPSQNKVENRGVSSTRKETFS